MNETLGSLTQKPALALAISASAAGILTPALLRSLRLHLHQDLDPGAEADVILSDAVRSIGPRFIHFHDDALADLRNRLRQRVTQAGGNDIALRPIRRVLDARVPQPPVTILIQERLLLHWLAGKDVRDLELQRQLGAVLLATKAKGREAFAQWAAHMLMQLPAEIQNSDAGMATALVARVRSGLPGPDRLSTDVLRRYLPHLIGDAVGDTPLGIRLVGSMLDVNARTTLSSEYALIHVPATEPRYLEISYAGSKSIVLAVPAGASRELTVGQGSLELRDGRGRRWKVAKFEKETNPSEAYEAEIRQKRASLQHSETVEERMRVYEEIIAIYKDKLRNPQKAIAAYFEALDLKPDARSLLVDLLELLSETKQWKRAVEILLRLANLETGKAKAKFLETAGLITNVELHLPDEAVELFNQALDANPDHLKPFERIDKIMMAKKDWTNQERNYRRMIKRLGQEIEIPEKKTLQLALWQGLGEICRSRLKMYREAAQAFEVCALLEPDNVGRHQRLAELYEVQGPEGYEKAIREYRLLMLRTKEPKDMVPALKRLRRLYAELGKYDQMWSVTSTLSYLKEADAEELRFFEQYRSKNLARVRARLTEDNWQRQILHGNENRLISLVLACISPTVLAARAREHRKYGLRRRDKRDVASDRLMFSGVLVYVSQILGVSLPEIFLREDWAGDLEFVSARERNAVCPALIVGTRMLRGRMEKELAYALGKGLTLVRADHVLRWPQIVPRVSELQAFFLAALKLVQPELPVKADEQEAVDECFDLLKGRLPPQQMELLAEVARRFFESKAEADVHEWTTAVDYTSTRAGFLLCNDLEVAAQQVLYEPITVGSATPKDKIRDLIQWSVSDEYFELRSHLGLAIG